jgi:hypothetical protein
MGGREKEGREIRPLEKGLGLHIAKNTLFEYFDFFQTKVKRKKQKGMGEDNGEEKSKREYL